MKCRAGKRTDGGFSLIELLVVVLITLVVAAMAAPTMVSAIASYRLREAATSLGGLLQNARMNSVRTNTATGVQWDTTGGHQRVYVDLPTNTSSATANKTFDAGEPMVEFPRGVSLVAAGHPGNAATGQWTGFTGITDNANPYFNPRGLPCTMPVSMSLCGNIQPYVLYLKADNVLGRTMWAAVTVTPAGRIRSWSYQTNKYQ
jgi:prepilin-type N-terminal cleavage/methylation domain-containing protein